MSGSDSQRSRAAGWLLAAVVCAATLAGAGPVCAAVGVEAMERFDELPYFKPGTACYQFSSHDRRGWNDDGYFGTYSYLYQWDTKYVVLDVIGPGCVYNIWCTGDIPGKGNIQFYFDNEGSPRINMPLSQLFAGSTAPFVTPLVGSNVSGGYYCYVPIPFAQRLIVAVTQFTSPFYYHITYHKYASAEGVQSYTGSEDMSRVLTMWNNVGSDPKDTTGNQVLSGTVSVAAQQAATLANLTGAGSIASIKVNCTSAALSGAWLKMYWDGEVVPSASAPLRHFFGSGLGAANVSSLPLGMTTAGQHYCYFPMPYWESARIEVSNQGTSTITGLGYEIQYKTTPYGAGAGYFRAKYRWEQPTTLGKDYTILSTTGRGQFVGVVHTMAGRGTTNRDYLEGDERVHVDDSLSPCLYGTGTEDYYLGGWYFDNGKTFNRPCHGFPVHQVDTVDRSVCYRFHLSDCIPYQSSILVGIEHGGTNDIDGDYSSVAYYYEIDEFGLEQTDSLDVGNAASEAAHGYTFSGQTWSGTQTLYYEGDNDNVAIADNGRAFTGQSEFTVAINPSNEGVRLRRRADHISGNQRAAVWVDGALVGNWYSAGNNQERRWLDADFEIPAAYTQGKSSIQVRIQYISAGSGWNEYYYWVYSHRPWLIATTSPAGLLKAGWNLLSVPRQPDDPDPPAVFAGIGIEGRLYRYDTESGYASYPGGDPPSFGEVDAKSGYWLYLDAPSAVSYAGRPMDTQATITLATPGWHLIGAPAPGTVLLDSLTFIRGSLSYPFLIASRQGWIDPKLWGYDPSIGSYFTCGRDLWDAANYLAPWYGYWIHTNVDNVTIAFPRW